jgi:hypothetical protein
MLRYKKREGQGAGQLTGVETVRGGNGGRIKRELNRRIGETVSRRNVAPVKKVGVCQLTGVKTVRGGNGETEKVSHSPIHRFSVSPVFRYAGSPIREMRS